MLQLLHLPNEILGVIVDYAVLTGARPTTTRLHSGSTLTTVNNIAGNRNSIEWRDEYASYYEIREAGRIKRVHSRFVDMTNPHIFRKIRHSISVHNGSSDSLWERLKHIGSEKYTCDMALQYRAVGPKAIGRGYEDLRQLIAGLEAAPGGTGFLSIEDQKLYPSIGPFESLQSLRCLDFHTILMAPYLAQLAPCIEEVVVGPWADGITEAQKRQHLVQTGYLAELTAQPELRLRSLKIQEFGQKWVALVLSAWRVCTTELTLHFGLEVRQYQAPDNLDGLARILGRSEVRTISLLEGAPDCRIGPGNEFRRDLEARQKFYLALRDVIMKESPNRGLRIRRHGLCQSALTQWPETGALRTWVLEMQEVTL